LPRERPRFLFSERRSPALQAAVAVLVFCLTAAPIEAGNVGGLEADVFGLVNGLPRPLVALVWPVMQLGNLLAAPIAAAAAASMRRFRLAFDLAVAGIGVWLLAKLVKDLVPRGRPGRLLEDVVLRNSPAGGSGFISGHAAIAGTLAAVATPYLGRPGRIVVWALAAGVAFARVYVGAHLPLDVIGGLAVGWAAGSLLHVLLGAPAGDEGRPPRRGRHSGRSPARRLER
jgi:glycosyltransferase 2 family protein